MIPERMRAVVYHRRRDLRVEERPVPDLGPGDALLRVSHCGVCGTDLHFVMDGWGRPGSIGGHEFSGRIAALGAEVEGFAIGDAVVGGPEPGCGVCAPCRARKPSLCTGRGAPGMSEFQGAFAEFVRVPAAQLLRVPHGLPMRDAALAEPLAVALHGITLSGLEAGGRALVTGVGPIGLLTLAALRARGVEDVVVSEPSAVRRELALAIGARRAVEPDALEAPRMPFTLVAEPFDAAFECSGRASAVEAALAQLGKAGTLVLSGTGAERPPLDVHRVILNELSIAGAYCYDEGGMDEALALLASGALPNERLLHPVDVALDEMLPALEELAAGRIGGKLLVVPEHTR